MKLKEKVQEFKSNPSVDALRDFVKYVSDLREEEIDDPIECGNESCEVFIFALTELEEIKCEAFDQLGNLCRNEYFRDFVAIEEIFVKAKDILEDDSMISTEKSKVLRAIANTCADSMKGRGLMCDVGLDVLVANLCVSDSRLLSEMALIAISNLVMGSPSILEEVWNRKVRDLFPRMVLNGQGYRKFGDFVDAIVTCGDIGVNFLLDIDCAKLVLDAISNKELLEDHRKFLADSTTLSARGEDNRSAIERQLTLDGLLARFNDVRDSDELAAASYLEIISGLVAGGKMAKKFVENPDSLDIFVKLTEDRVESIRIAAIHVLAELSNDTELSKLFFKSEILEVFKNALEVTNKELNFAALVAISNIQEDSHCEALLDEGFLPLILKFFLYSVSNDIVEASNGDNVNQSVAAGIIRNLILFRKCPLLEYVSNSCLKGPARQQLLKEENFLPGLAPLLKNENPVVKLIPIVILRHLSGEFGDHEGKEKPAVEFFKLELAPSFPNLLESSEFHILGESLRTMIAYATECSKCREIWSESEGTRKKIQELTLSENKFIRAFAEELTLLLQEE